MGQHCCSEDNLYQGGFDNFQINNGNLRLENYTADQTL